MKAKRYQEMNAAELAATTKEFDEPFVVDKSRPLTAAERDRWRKVKRGRGRPKAGKGFKRISVSIEASLLERVTAAARKRRMPRSRFLAEAIEAALAGAPIRPGT
jgi:hypothetical protein